MSKRISNLLATLRTAFAYLVITMALLVVSGICRANSYQFVAIISNPDGKGNPTAQIDFACDPMFAGLPVYVNIFDPDTGAEFPKSGLTMIVNSAGFVTTASVTNLFAVSGGRTAMVKVWTQDAPGLRVANAILRQKAGGADVVVAITPQKPFIGVPTYHGFSVPVAVGDLSSPATLLITNFWSEPQDVLVTAGGVTIAATPVLQKQAVWQVSLPATAANSYVGVIASGPIVVQLVVGKNEVMVLPEPFI